MNKVKKKSKMGLQPLSASGIHRSVMAKPTKLKVSERPQFRPGKLMCYALQLYNEETVHNNSQTMRMALKRFLPQKYFDQAAKLLNGATGKSRKAVA